MKSTMESLPDDALTVLWREQSAPFAEYWAIQSEPLRLRFLNIARSVFLRRLVGGDPEADPLDGDGDGAGGPSSAASPSASPAASLGSAGDNQVRRMFRMLCPDLAAENLARIAAGDMLPRLIGVRVQDPLACAAHDAQYVAANVPASVRPEDRAQVIDGLQQQRTTFTRAFLRDVVALFVRCMLPTRGESEGKKDEGGGASTASTVSTAGSASAAPGASAEGMPFALTLYQSLFTADGRADGRADTSALCDDPFVLLCLLEDGVGQGRPQVGPFSPSSSPPSSLSPPSPPAAFTNGSGGGSDGDGAGKGAGGCGGAGAIVGAGGGVGGSLHVAKISMICSSRVQYSVHPEPRRYALRFASKHTAE